MARAGLTAERLTRAAAELADEVGFDQVTVSALARRFGVKDASLYSHITNAQDLQVRVALLALEELADRAAAALAGRAGKDALVALRQRLPRLRQEAPGPLRRLPSSSSTRRPRPPARASGTRR